jgi:hypothetical protein
VLPLPGLITIDTMVIRAHTSFLAHDLLRGRGTGTLGAEFAATYITSVCRAEGLEPVGNAYQHEVPLEAADIRPEATALHVIRSGGDTVRFAFEHDFVFAGGSRAMLRGFSGQPVWVGSETEIADSSQALPPLLGRVALTAGPVRSSAADRLSERGAAAMVHLVGDEGTFRRYAASRADLMALSDTTVHSSFFPRLPSIIAGPRLSEALLRPTRPAPLVILSVEVLRRPVRGYNVVCLLPGSDPRLRDTAIVFTAHYDHLGVGLPDERGDSIYNGFSDNAAGVAMLLAIARAFRDTPRARPRHSVLFIFFTGEERGLLGSDYYVAHPSFPLDRTRAVINLDAGAPPARPWNWRIAGGYQNALGSLAMDVAAARGWTATTSLATPNSDYFPFARRGVPAVFIIPGSGPYEGVSSDSSQALRRSWDHYHQQADEWNHAFPFEGLQRYAEYAMILGLAVDRDPGSAGGS